MFGRKKTLNAQADTSHRAPVDSGADADTIVPRSLIPAPLSGAKIVPATQAAVFRIALPVRGEQARRQAAAYALEDQIAEDLDDVHVALGDVIDAQTSSVLAVVVDRSVMQNHLQSQSAKTALLPEQLLLPVPREPGHWTVFHAADRVVVRKDDHTGFGATLAFFAILWARADKPKIHSFGTPLPAEFAAIHSDGLPDPAHDVINLRQGVFASEPASFVRLARACVILLTLGVVVQMGLLKADISALQSIQTRALATAQSAVAPHLPNHRVTPDSLALVQRAVTQSTDTKTDPFLALFARVSIVLADPGLDVRFERLSYDAGGQMTLRIQAATLAQFQAVEATLKQNGLTVRSGAAVVGAAGASGEILISGGA